MLGRPVLIVLGASVHDTHLREPLWIHHPGLAPQVVADLVSSRDLYNLLVQAADGPGPADRRFIGQTRAGGRGQKYSAGSSVSPDASLSRLGIHLPVIMSL